jgi:hypothetical protein
MRSRPVSISIPQTDEWNSFDRSFNLLYRRALKRSLPFDPKFNTIHWAFDVHRLIREIAYSFCLMKTSAQHYKDKVPPNSEPSHVDFLVSYYADNCITRLDSCRDKLALMIWAFYCAFNPEKREEVLDYHEVVKRLRFPMRYGIRLRNSETFLANLTSLDGKEFKQVRSYRNLKTHRREPRIEIHGVTSHHDWSYMVPIYEQKDITRFMKDLAKTYPDEQMQETVLSGCYFDGVLFEQRKLKDRVWAYKGIQTNTELCLFKLLRASGSCFGILANRRPFR